MAVVKKPAKLVFPAKYNKRDMRQLLPTAQASLILVLKDCVRHGIPIFLVDVYRLAAEQHKNFLAGTSQLDSGHSMHEFRLAVDIACKGKELYNLKILAAAATMFRSHGWTCGADFKKGGKPWPDRPHFQFVTVAEQAMVYKLKTPEAIEDYLKRRNK